MDNCFVKAPKSYENLTNLRCDKKIVEFKLRTKRRNPYLKAVDYVIHGKLRDSWKTM